MEPQELDTMTLVQLLGERAVQQVRERPAVALASAAGVGFAIGKAVPDRVFRLALRMLVRSTARKLFFSTVSTSPTEAEAPT